MKIYIIKKDILAIIITAILLFTVIILGWWTQHTEILIMSFAIGICLVVFILLEIYRRNLKYWQETYKNLHKDYKQIEALMVTIPLLELKHPLSPMGDWAISPDMANILISAIFEQKPKFILECGSGVSTLLMAYCLKKLKRGMIWSLEHDEKYVNITRKNLRLHDLENIATVIYAPLKKISLQDKYWMWYNTAFLRKIKLINFLVIDGPPGEMQKIGERYPALPILFEKLSDDCIVIIDDAKREYEKKIIEVWLNEFKVFECEWYDTEKGTVILQRKSKD